jgi:Na+/H+-translocating membrane pyrophosphatase
VGDNVGDIAGMGADLFGSFAESTCAALVVAAVSELGANHNWPAMMFPLMISATGIIVCILTTLVATDLKPARHISEIEHTLKMQLIISTVIMTPVSADPSCWGVHERAGQGQGWLGLALIVAEASPSTSARLSPRPRCSPQRTGVVSTNVSTAPASV